SLSLALSVSLCLSLSLSVSLSLCLSLSVSLSLCLSLTLSLSPSTGPVPSESSEDVPASQPLPTQASPARGKMVSPSSTPAELGDTTSLSPSRPAVSLGGGIRCALPTSGDSSPGGDEAIAMNLNDSQKLCAQIPDSLGALESHRSSLLPVAEEEEMTVESATDAVDMAGTHPERSDVTTATSGVNGCPADSPNKADREGGNTTSDTAGPPGSSRAGADTRLSPPGGDRDALQDKQQKGLEKEQSMEALEGQKGREDSEVSAATEKEGESSMVSEDTSEQDDRRNSWSLSASEKEVETEFHRLSLSFKCDMYTLEKRLRLEERSRDLAEENVRKEVASCQGLLQALSPLCEDDSQSVEIIQRLQKNLDILIQAMVRVSSRSETLGAIHQAMVRVSSRSETLGAIHQAMVRVSSRSETLGAIHQAMVRVSSRSETLGAIHQESRVGKAVEVMIQHVENLRRTYTKEHAELIELRESVSNSERSFGPHTDRGESVSNASAPLARTPTEASPCPTASGPLARTPTEVSPCPTASARSFGPHTDRGESVSNSERSFGPHTDRGESVSNSERSFGPHTDRDELSRLKKQSGSQYYKQSSSRRVSIAVIPRSGGAGLDMSKSPDSGEVETDRLSRRSPWKAGGGGQRPPLKRFVSSGGWPDGEGPRNSLDDTPSFSNRFGYDTDSHSEEERREEPVVVERRKSSLTELGNKLTSLIMPLKMQSQTPSPTHSKEQTTPPSHTPEPRTTTYPSTSSSSYLSTWRAGLGLGRGLWVWVLVLVVLACLLGLLASLLLQPAADAAPVGTGDSWMTIQQLLWPYASLRHNGQPPV
ncbi:hypothetical protein ACEWY4_027785, partial [Coilia grayii]